MTHSPLFITFEGIDGAGKSTQIERLAKRLEEQGESVLVTREPGGTPVGEKIRGLLLADDMTPKTETLLFFAARAQHIRDVILPAVKRGAWVLSDRFTDATYAYQVGGKHYSAENVLKLEAIVQQGFGPNKTVLFDLAPETAARRLALSRTADRFETQDRDFFTQVRNAYLARAEADPERFFVLNAEQAPAVITQQLLEEARRWFDVA